MPPPGIAVGEAPEHRREKGRDDCFDRRRLRARLLPRQFELLPALVVNDARAPRDHFVQKIFLGAEVIVGERKIHTGTLGDGAERDTVEPAFGKTPLGRVQDREPGGIAAARDDALAARLRLALRRIPPRFWRCRALDLFGRWRALPLHASSSPASVAGASATFRGGQLDSISISTFNEIE